MFTLLILVYFTVRVTVERTFLKTSPDFFSDNVAIVSYGTSLKADTIIAGWYRVIYKGKRAYLHESAARSFKGISIARLSKVTGKEEDAISLAAKGFEESNVTGVKGYNLKDVKYLEKFKVSLDDIKRFKEQGEL